MFDNRRDAVELVLKIEARWSNTDILRVFKVLRWYFRKRYQREIYALKRFVDVVKQCKQSLDNKKLQLSSRNNKSRLKMSWTRFIRESCLEDLYTKEDSSCSLCSLSSISSTARSARCRACRARRTLLAQLAIEHVEHCSLVKSSNMQAIVLRATCCTVVNIPRCFELDS
jgi:hypothetical protein